MTVPGIYWSPATAVVCVNGVFGTNSGHRRTLRRNTGGRGAWGNVIDPADIAAALRRCRRPKLVAIVRAETSTGAATAGGLAPLARGGALLVVDAVTIVGGSMPS
jgi:alanine-glyoxylate transaminase/serine-glyoxylate transaminase/serine-pyruvate transaminase